MEIKNYILATAGHVDHGKSALVWALTGIDPDRLPEEKARGITIDLGFAHLDLPLAASIARVGIIDVPGHEDFVKNMVAGVGSIDLALLVVAADDGWMPQTEEHLQILDYLGVSCGVIALTKCDLASSIEAAEKELRGKSRGTPLADAPIVPTSIVNGQGLDRLKQALAELLSRMAPQPDIGKPRLAVDRAFTLHGFGTVVTGTLTGGTLRRGQSIIVQPGGIPAKIRTLHSYNRRLEQATPGSRVALNLPDLQPGTSVKRGDVITLSDLGTSHDTLDVLLESSGRPAKRPPIKHGTLLWVHHGSSNVPGVVHLLDASTLAPGGRALAQIRLRSPAFAFLGDRFVLRDWSQRRTLAGAIVLDPHASQRGFRTAQRRQYLEIQATHHSDVKLLIQSAMARDSVVQMAQLLVQSRFSAEEIHRMTERLIREGHLVALRERVADAQWWQELHRQALATIDAAHAAHPESPGLPLTDLRHVLPKTDHLDLMDVLVEELCRSECARNGMAIRRIGHRPALPPQLRAAAERLRSTLLAGGLDAPSRSQLASDAASQQALRFLVLCGDVIEISPEIIVHAEHYQKALRTIRQLLADNRPATISQLKQALGTTRRVMVPLAEKLDRDGVTYRQGDQRVLRTV